MLDGREELRSVEARELYCGWEALGLSSADDQACRKLRRGFEDSGSLGRVSVQRVNGRHDHGHRWHGDPGRYRNQWNPSRRLEFHTGGVRRGRVHPDRVDSVGTIRLVRAGCTATGNRHRRGSTRCCCCDIGSAACRRIQERSGRDRDSCLGSGTSRAHSDDRPDSARKNVRGRCSDELHDHNHASAEPLQVVFAKRQR